MRHAKSDWHNQLEDFDRPLNKRGRHNARLMGHFLQEKNLVPDILVYSSSQRARETLELMSNGWIGRKPQTIVEKSLYLAGLNTLLDNIRAYYQDSQRLMLLAHNPGMDEVVDYLATSRPGLTANGKLMVTAAIAVFTVPDIVSLDRHGQCGLSGLYRPREVSR